jgi:hypothetical protein
MSQADYCKYYDSQRGGEIPVFRGGSQSGAGFGDILRGLFRFLMPVALRGIQSFAGNTLSGTQAGMSLPSAARAAIVPALSAAAGPAGPTVSRIVNAIAPELSGASKQRGGGTLFDGENGVPTTDKAIQRYKRAADSLVGISSPKRARRAKKAHEGGTHYNF